MRSSPINCEESGKERPCDLSIENALVASLGELRDALKAGEKLEERFTMRTVELDLVSIDPPAYTPEQVKKTREDLGASQAVFARLIGVRPKTVQSWEQGVAPTSMACRVLEMISQNPEHWKEKLRSAVRAKASA